MSDFSRPYVMSIAGFDPSAGAGILADIKTFEASRAYGLGVCSAITFQNDQEFEGVSWISKEDILHQAAVLLKKYPVTYVKIGLVENADVLLYLIREMHLLSPGLLFIWDLKASAGFDFLHTPNQARLNEICAELFLITPNIPEAVELGESGAAELNASVLSEYCNVFLKGGHHPHKAGEDFLFLKKGKRISFGGRTFKVQPKHGSGCILSSAIAARLAKGAELEKACLLAKDYILEVLESNDSLLGYHSLS
jgi:hydroxymethylpyrimidine/phosphomethylpyrimidine kinase